MVSSCAACRSVDRPEVRQVRVTANGTASVSVPMRVKATRLRDAGGDRGECGVRLLFAAPGDLEVEHQNVKARMNGTSLHGAACMHWEGIVRH